MVERSARDRDGVGSNPTSGLHTANPGYAASQLAKALITSEQHEDADTRERATQKAQKWASVFSQMLAGSLQVGSRTPVDSVPAWATLEIVTGGFATGELLAGGPLRDHERNFVASHALEADADDRRALNQYFLSEAGLAELTERLERGTYEIGVPEEGALLVVAWLMRSGHHQQARDLLDQLAPFMSRLRFFPIPTERPQQLSSRVFVQDVNTTIESLPRSLPTKRSPRSGKRSKSGRRCTMNWSPCSWRRSKEFRRSWPPGPMARRARRKMAATTSKAAGLAKRFLTTGPAARPTCCNGSSGSARSTGSAPSRCIASRASLSSCLI